MIEIAKDNKDVIDEPKPTAGLVKFGESMLQFELRVWTRTRLHTSGGMKSAINLEIVRRFRKNGIKLDAPPLAVEHVAHDGTPLGQSDDDFDEMSETRGVAH